MFLSSGSIRRPVAMSCLIIALSLLGLRSYQKMGLEWLPKVDFPIITIVTVYPGGSPREIETDVAKRIEDVVVSVEGLDHVTSMCMENVCQMMLEFELDVDVDVAANDVREKLDLIANELPSDAEKPKVLKFDLNAQPIISLALTGDVPVDALYDYADNKLRDQLSVIGGVADVQIIGGAEREVNVLLDRHKLAAKGLSSMDVCQAIREGVRMVPSGRVRDGDSEYTVKFDADVERIAGLGMLELPSVDGQRCYIRDVGEVRMATEEMRQISYIDGEPCIGIKVVKKAEANAVRVVNLVREAVASWEDQLPGGMHLVWVADDAQFIKASVDDTQISILQGIVLTALVLLFFLYNLRTTIIATVTMPLTIVIGLFFIGFLGYTLNISTLLALGLSVGILVTNSIVVLESITKRFNESGNAKEAARIGAREVAVAVAASAGTNLVVLFPIATMGSMVGLFFAPFAWTMAIMTAVSLFISFTLTPILCSVLLKQRPAGSKSPLAIMERGFNRVLGGITKGFGATLRFFEKRRPFAVAFLAVVAGIFVASLQIAGYVGIDFFPNIDRGEIYVKLEFPTRYNLDTTVGRMKEVEAILRALPELEHVFTTIGKVEGTIGRSSEGVYLAQLLLKFSRKDEREIGSDALAEMVRDRLSRYPDCIVSVAQPSGSGGQGTPISLTIAGDDFDVLDRLALRIEEFAEESEGILDPDTTVRIGKPELRVRPRRAILADLDMPAVGLGMALRANIEGLEAGTYKEGGRNYDIVVKMAEEVGKEQVRDFQVPGAPGHPVVLGNFADIEEGYAPIQITRKNKQRISKLFAGHDGPLLDVVNALSQRIDEEGKLPPGYSYRFYGDVEIMEEGNAAMAEAALIAIVLVYLVLAAILESFRQPFIILLTLPLGLIGILWALGIAGQAISMFVMLGSVMLIGIVVNNAILIMDQVNQHVAGGVPRHEAMVQAACERFRPIVMITFAAVLGMLPLALGRGVGSEVRTAIGIASVGGILVSAALTLVVLPIVYDVFTRREGKKEKGSKVA